MTRDPEFEAWVDRARDAKVEEVLFKRYSGLKIRKSSEGYEGQCPRCGGDDRFSINTKKNVWHCRHAKRGGDAIALLEYVEDLKFTEAVREITGEDMPGRATGPREYEESTVAREQRAERRREAQERETEEERHRRETLETCKDLWRASIPLSSTLAARYLAQRAIIEQGGLTDLRFIDGLEYVGYAGKGEKEQTVLGAFPAMLGAIRDHTGNLIGVHRTYLDPKTARKLDPPGDKARNAAKKVLGSVKGGAIRLGPLAEVMACGEGIETTLSWGLLNGNGEIGLLCGVSLGNICGRATGSRPHPRNKNFLIPNGDPDLDAPGLVLPDCVKAIILLGDGDSDAEATTMKLLVAARRFRAQGKEVSVSFADEKSDFNDMLRRVAA